MFTDLNCKLALDLAEDFTLFEQAPLLLSDGLGVNLPWFVSV